ncbi:mannose-P-dolichol utilization defect 1 protein-like [Lineus longissimus]|uniref:mannose-P-dolichol utilization defect 1 protein-like n=1 Tax=Lineus longissimus TaxID=88925 RepID=UPI002B4E5797
MAGNSTNFLVPWIQILLPQPCYNEVLVEFNFFHVACLKIFISKCLGFGIILGSILVKLPQIIKIFVAKSGQGISMTSVILELVAISGNAAYGFAQGYPFSSYGEGFFLIIQTATIGFLVLVFSDQLGLSLVFSAVISAVMAFLLSPAVPVKMLALLQAGNVPVIVVSKLIQAFQNFQQGSTGQLSAITLMLLFLGAFARIFTSIQETGDTLIILTYVVATTCNGILVAQLLYYWGKTAKTKAE